MTSIHGPNAKEAVRRLINMIEEGDTKLSYDAIGRLIASTIDIIIFQDKLPDRSRKWSEIIELTDFKDGEGVLIHFTLLKQKILLEIMMKSN